MVLQQVFYHFFLGVERFEVVQAHGFHGNFDFLVLANAQRALLFGEVVVAGVDKHFFRYQTHYFAAAYANATGGSFGADLLESHVHGSNGDVGDVHRNLSYAVFLNKPADSLGAFESAGNHDGVAVGVFHGFSGNFAAFALWTAFFAHVESYGVGAACGGGVEVVVDGHKEIAGAYLCGSGVCHVVVPCVGAEVGFPLFGAEARRERLVFAGAAVGEVAAFGHLSGLLVAVDGDIQLRADALCQLVGVAYHFVHGDVGNGDEGAYVGGTLARVVAVVVAHVDKFGGFLHHTVGGFAHGLRLAYKSDNGAVGGGTRIHVQKFNAFNLLYLGSYLIDDVYVASFADIGNAFDYFFHFVFWFIFLLFKYL